MIFIYEPHLGDRDSWEVAFDTEEELDIIFQKFGWGLPREGLKEDMRQFGVDAEWESTSMAFTEEDRWIHIYDFTCLEARDPRRRKAKFMLCPNWKLQEEMAVEEAEKRLSTYYSWLEEY